MKSVQQRFTEKVAVLRARGKGEAVDAILTEKSEYTMEAQLAALDEFSRSLNPAKPIVVKHNGAADNANHQESFNESNAGKGNDVGREALIEAAMKGFGLSKEEAERFASPTGSGSVESKWADLLKETK